MQPFEDMRLIKILPLYPCAVHKAFVVVIVIGLAIIGGLVFSKTHDLQKMVSDLEDLRRFFSIFFLFLCALGQLSRIMD